MRVTETMGNPVPNAVVIRGDELHHEYVDFSLDGMRNVVGGYLEAVHIGQGFLLLCNEDGIALGLDRNALGILGNAIICKSEGEDIVGLDAEEIEFVTSMLSAGKFPFTGKGF